LKDRRCGRPGIFLDGNLRTSYGWQCGTKDAFLRERLGDRNGTIPRPPSDTPASAEFDRRHGGRFRTFSQQHVRVGRADSNRTRRASARMRWQQAGDIRAGYGRLTIAGTGWVTMAADTLAVVCLTKAIGRLFLNSGWKGVWSHSPVVDRMTGGATLFCKKIGVHLVLELYGGRFRPSNRS